MRGVDECGSERGGLPCLPRFIVPNTTLSADLGVVDVVALILIELIIVRLREAVVLRISRVTSSLEGAFYYQLSRQ
jgi:hypothetical protein